MADAVERCSLVAARIVSSICIGRPRCGPATARTDDVAWLRYEGAGKPVDDLSRCQDCMREVWTVQLMRGVSPVNAEGSGRVSHQRDVVSVAAAREEREHPHPPHS